MTSNPLSPNPQGSGTDFPLAVKPEPNPTPIPDEAYWEERIRRMTQMSQDIDDGLYDDVPDPRREAGIRLITDQLPDGYAFDHDESRIVRFDPDLPDTFIIKGEAGNDLPTPAPTVLHPAEADADPERFETRTEPAPAPQCKYWKAHLRRVAQIWKDAENGLYDNLIDPLSENAIRLITDQLPDGYAYDHRESRIVRFDPDLPDAITIRDDGINDQPWPVPIVIHPAEAEANPDRYETRT